MSGSTSVVSSTPGFVSGTFGAKDVRLATMTNETPGLFAAGDFAVSQRAAGANMSLDIADGRALINPAVSTHQGLYVVRKSAGTAYNTSVDGGYTWTAADATNPRIDLLCIEIKDTAEDASGTTGYRFRIVDGTANAGATHQLEAAYWPAVPSGCLPIAAIRVPATATTLTTANITSLNPMGGAGRAAAVYTTTAETTASTTFARLATPDFAMVYVPNGAAAVRLNYEAHWKISVASGTQAVTIYVDGAQLKYRNLTNAAPVVGSYDVVSLGTFYSRLITAPAQTAFTATAQFFSTAVGATADVSDITTGLSGHGQSSASNVGPVDITQLAAGWHLVELRFKTSANTLTVRERRLRAEVVG